MQINACVATESMRAGFSSAAGPMKCCVTTGISVADRTRTGSGVPRKSLAALLFCRSNCRLDPCPSFADLRLRIVGSLSILLEETQHSADQHLFRVFAVHH